MEQRKSFGLGIETIERFARGDLKAYMSIYEFYFPRLYAFAYAYLKEKDDVEEVVQDTFLKVWENKSSITNYLTFNNYLYSIVKNKVLDLIRKRIIRDKYVASYMKDNKDYDNSTIEMLEYEEFENLVNTIVSQMPPQRQLIFKLSRNEGYSHKKIAEKLNISAKTVENQIRQAIIFIKQNLTENHASHYLFLFLVLFL